MWFYKTTWSKGHVMWLCGQLFRCHRHCGSGDIMILLCHLISRDNVIKGSCEFIGRSSSRKVTFLPSLVAIGTVGMEIARHLEVMTSLTSAWLASFDSTPNLAEISINLYITSCMNTLERVVFTASICPAKLEDF